MHQSVLFRLHNFTFANSSRNISSDISISIHFLCNLSVRFHGQSTAGHSNRGLKRPTFLAMCLNAAKVIISMFAFVFFSKMNDYLAIYVAAPPTVPTTKRSLFELINFPFFQRGTMKIPYFNYWYYCCCRGCWVTLNQNQCLSPTP